MAIHYNDHEMTVSETIAHNHETPHAVFCDFDRMPPKFYPYLIVDYIEISSGIVYYYTHRKHPKRLTELLADLNEHSPRSAWQKGVKAYAEELLESLAESILGSYFDPDDIDAPKMLRNALLNGAPNWTEYSWGGCSLIYNDDIAERLCTPSELKRTRNGERRPNAQEEWLDTQARALRQAETLIFSLARKSKKGATI